MKKIALLVNPLAGIGGAVAFKGTDGEEIVAPAMSLGAEKTAERKVLRCLEYLHDHLENKNSVKWYSAAGCMGADCLKMAGFDCQIIYDFEAPSTQQDSINCVNQLLKEDIDLIVFAGGDGTARDVCSALAQRIPVIGIPCGVKIHSGVYATTMLDAARCILSFVQSALNEVALQEVRDIDEQAFRQNRLQSKFYGEMLCLAEPQYIQSVKMGGVESDELLNLDIADYLIEQLEEDCLYFVGSGKTLDCMMQQLALPNSLLGVDAIFNRQLIASDISAREIHQLCDQYRFKVLVSVIGGQGHIFGRGNHQFDADFLSHLKKEQLIVVANKRKLQQLTQPSLIIDSLDQQFVTQLTGYISVLCAYDQWIYFPVR